MMHGQTSAANEESPVDDTAYKLFQNYRVGFVLDLILPESV